MHSKSASLQRHEHSKQDSFQPEAFKAGLRSASLEVKRLADYSLRETV